MEEAGIAYFSELLIRSFFEPSRSFNGTEVFLMHDLIHDLALSISSPNCCQVKDNESGKLLLGTIHDLEQSRHVSFLVINCQFQAPMNVEKPMLEIVNTAPKLRSLLLPIRQDRHQWKISGQALDKVFRTLKYLRGLDLSSSLIEEVPDSIQELKLLRYLDLSRTRIGVLPDSICNLFNLRTLKLLLCDQLSGLPKDLGNLVNLRHLELGSSFRLLKLSMPVRMGNLTGLQNLPVFQVGRENGCGIEQLENMAHLSGTLHISKLENAVNAGNAKLNEKKNLYELVFEWSCRDDVNKQDQATIENTVLKDLQPHSNLKKLKIVHYMGNEFPAWMKEGRLQNLVSLTLNGCKKCKTLALGGQLPKLRELYIFWMPELEKWTEGEYHFLDLLVVSNCPRLRELPIVFRNLRELKIERCNSLRALPRTPSLEFLELIDNLILEDWNEIMLKPVEVVNDQGQPETRNVYPSFIKLLELKVRDCPKLQARPDFFFPQRIKKLELDGALMRAIPNTSSLEKLSIYSISNIKWPQLPGLRELYIRDCKDLVSLSSNGEEGSLPLTSLKILCIQNCQMLETLPNEELPTSLEELIIESCPLLESIGPKEILKNLFSLGTLSIEYSPMLQSLPEGGLPTSLKYLRIQKCPLLKSIGPKEILKNLPSLRTLFIIDCPMLRSLPEGGLPTSLIYLKIKKCPMLTERCQKEGGGGPEWPKIAHIPDLEID